MDDNGDPKCFALTRARQLVLKLDEQFGNIVQLAKSGLPALGIVQIDGVLWCGRRWRRNCRLGRDFCRWHRTTGLPCETRHRALSYLDAATLIAMCAMSLAVMAIVLFL